MNLKNLILIPVTGKTNSIDTIINSVYKNNLGDILIIDDDSPNDFTSVFKVYPDVVYIKHEKSQGYGAALITGFKYGNDYGYDIITTINEESDNFTGDIRLMLENMKYGYDIINCSRILENYNHTEIPDSYIKTTQKIAEEINKETNYNLTDPLSGIKAFRLKSIKNMELTELGHGLFLQIWIQSAYFGFNVYEVPSDSPENFGDELNQYEDSIDYFLSIIETEKHLYNKGTIN